MHPSPLSQPTRGMCIDIWDLTSSLPTWECHTQPSMGMRGGYVLPHSWTLGRRWRFMKSSRRSRHTLTSLQATHDSSRRLLPVRVSAVQLQNLFCNASWIKFISVTVRSKYKTELVDFPVGWLWYLKCEYWLYTVAIAALFLPHNTPFLNATTILAVFTEYGCRHIELKLKIGMLPS